MTRTDGKVDVRATLNYTKDTGVQPEIYYHETERAAHARMPGDDPREMPIHDGWHRATSFALDKEGFALRRFRSSFDAWDDDEAVKARLYPEVVAFMRTETGARRVDIFDHTIRAGSNDGKKLTQETSTSQRAPVQRIHGDYTPNSGPRRIRQLLPDEAETLLSRRVAFYNLWKPIRRVVEERPLAMCDVTTATEGDLIPVALRYRTRDGEIYAMRHAPTHKWWYFPRMSPDDAILLKTYESETDGRARFVGHTAFKDPGSSPDAPFRESIEVRMAAFF